MRKPAALSAINVTGMPSCCSSHAVSRALKERPRFVGEHLDLLAGIDSGADHPERRAVTGRGERACVAMREDTRAVAQ